MRSALQQSGDKNKGIDEDRIIESSPFFRMLGEKEDGAIIALFKDKQVRIYIDHVLIESIMYCISIFVWNT